MLINNLKSKFFIFLLLVITLINSSCTARLWSDKDEAVIQIGGFFIDKKNDRVVLLGKNIEGFHYESDNYSIQDKTEDKKLIKIFEIAEKSKNPVMNILNSSAKGRNFYGWLWVAFKKQENLTLQEKIFLESNNKLPESDADNNFKDFFGYGFQISNNDSRFPITKATRYLSSQEKDDNFCNKKITNNCIKITKFHKPKQITVSEEDTPKETAIKVIKTPFTVIGDIVLVPYYFLSLFIHATKYN